MISGMTPNESGQMIHSTREVSYNGGPTLTSTHGPSKSRLWVDEMAQRVKALAAKPCGMSEFDRPESHMVRENQFLQIVP